MKRRHGEEYTEGRVKNIHMGEGGRQIICDRMTKEVEEVLENY
jgi:hypothetical protein